MARPSEYTDAIGEDICRRMVNGQGLFQICEEMGLAGLETIFEWRRQHRSFSDIYTQARDDQGDAMDSLIVMTAKELKEKKIDPNSARVIIDAYKWRAERLKPKVYGAQGQVTHVSASAGDLNRMSIEDLRSLKAQILAPVIDQEGVAISPPPKK